MRGILYNCEGNAPEYIDFVPGLARILTEYLVFEPRSGRRLAEGGGGPPRPPPHPNHFKRFKRLDWLDHLERFNWWDRFMHCSWLNGFNDLPRLICFITDLGTCPGKPSWPGWHAWLA